MSFGTDDQRQLEQALGNGQLAPLIGGRQFDLQCMTQTNVKTKRQRTLRRIPATASPRGSSAGASNETVEISVSKMRMYNGQFWMTGRLDLYPSRLIFTPDQSQVRSRASASSVRRLMRVSVILGGMHY